jgi:hypothetical protein
MWDDVMVKALRHLCRPWEGTYRLFSRHWDCWWSLIRHAVIVMRYTTIPQDIVDTIIRLVRDDRATLIQCSQVSRLFLVPCSRYLFQTVDLALPPGLREHLLSGILSNKSGLERLIRNLEVKIGVWNLGTESSNDVGILTALEQIVEQGVLNTFRLIPYDTGNRKEAEWSALPPPVQRVLANLIQSRHVHSVTILNIFDVPVEIFGTGPALRHLCLVKDSVFSSDAMPIDQAKDLTPRETRGVYLESLGIAYKYMSNFVAYISREGCPLSIARLRHLCFIGYVPLNRGWNLMLSATENLETFSWIDSWGETFSPVKKNLCH